MASSISVHTIPLQFSEINGQTRHDLREKVPQYVDKTRTSENSVLIKPLDAKELFSICQELRKQRTDKVMKKNFRIGISGILTFSKEAQQVINLLDKEKQNELFKKAADKIAEFLNVTITGLVIHRDETAIHMHFQYPAYDKQGYPLSHSVDRKVLSQLQDIASEAFKEYNIGRGIKKEQRMNNGEDYASYIHRSVKELHEDLPKEIEQKKREQADLEKQIAEQQAKLEKNQRLIAQNEQKLAQGNLELEKIEKIEKNIEIYKKREADAAATIEQKVAEKTKLNNEIQNQKQIFDKYQKILDTENPPKPPQTRIIKEEVGFFKNLEREIIEPAEFRAYDKDKTIWATKTFSKENEKRKEDLDKKENDITEKEKKLQEKEKEINKKILIDAKYQNLVNDTAKQIMKIAGVDTKKELQQERAIDILRHFVSGGLSAVKDFLLNISKKNTLSR